MDNTAEVIMKKHIPDGCVNLTSYKKEKEMILAAMEEYRSIEELAKEEEIGLMEIHVEGKERLLKSCEKSLEKRDEEIAKLHKQLADIDPLGLVSEEIAKLKEEIANGKKPAFQISIDDKGHITQGYIKGELKAKEERPEIVKELISALETFEPHFRGLTIKSETSLRELLSRAKSEVSTQKEAGS